MRSRRTRDWTDKWFTESGANQIATINTTTGHVTELAAYGSSSTPVGLTSGADGGIWYVESNQIGIEEYKASVSKSYPYTVTSTDGPMYGIAAGANGDLYFTQQSDNQIGVFDPTTLVSNEVAVPTKSSGPIGITLGPDDNLWFTEFRFRPATRSERSIRSPVRSPRSPS